MRFKESGFSEHHVGEYANERADCTVRALMAVAGLPYGAAHEYARRAGRVNGQGLKTGEINNLLGTRFANYTVTRLTVKTTLQRRTRRNRDYLGYGTVYHKNVGPTLAEFVRLNPTGRYYIVTCNHALAIIDGVVHDTVRATPRARVQHVWKLEAL